LVTDPIAKVLDNSIVTPDGVGREVDVIIFGTGFHVTDFPFAGRVYGKGGLSLSEEWQGSPKAFAGTTVAGFPNLFLLQGPNTGLGHTSVLYMLEAQMEHIVNAMRFMRENNLATVEPRAEAQAGFVTEIDRYMPRTVWMKGGCKSWYLDMTGRNSSIWPWSSWGFRRRIAHFDPSNYLLSKSHTAGTVSSGSISRSTASIAPF